MKKPLFRNEDSVIQQKVTRPGSDGYVLFKMVFDPETGETESAVLGIHEHPAGIFQEWLVLVCSSGLLSPDNQYRQLAGENDRQLLQE
jgi:hypothetical protein